MLGSNEVVTFIFPIPPTSLIRKKEFPDCSEVFVKVAREARNPRAVGRMFSLLCRTTGFAWLVWAVNSILFTSIVILFIFHWSFGTDLSKTCYRIPVAIMLSMLFLGKMIFFASTVISLQLADRCHEGESTGGAHRDCEELGRQNRGAA